MYPYFDPETNKFHVHEGLTLEKIHDESKCAGRACIVHNPTDHSMRDFPLHWRPGWEPFSIKPSHFERICPHGIGHPDPDDLAYHDEVGNEMMGVHGCDGCCG